MRNPYTIPLSIGDYIHVYATDKIFGRYRDFDIGNEHWIIFTTRVFLKYKRRTDNYTTLFIDFVKHILDSNCFK